MSELRRVPPPELRAVERPRPMAAPPERLAPADRPSAPRIREETAERRAASAPGQRDPWDGNRQGTDRIPDSLTRFEPKRAGLPDVSRDDANHYIETKHGDRPWLNSARHERPEVQQVFAALDQATGHAHIRHEGWLSAEKSQLRVCSICKTLLSRIRPNELKAKTGSFNTTRITSAVPRPQLFAIPQRSPPLSHAVLSIRMSVALENAIVCTEQALQLEVGGFGALRDRITPCWHVRAVLGVRRAVIELEAGRRRIERRVRRRVQLAVGGGRGRWCSGRGREGGGVAAAWGMPAAALGGRDRRGCRCLRG
jgi:hypothetical protein